MVQFYWHISPPALSPLKRRKPYPNHVGPTLTRWISPVVFRKVLFSGSLVHHLHYTPLSSLVKASSVDHHLYADDTQLFISFSDSIDHFLHVVTQISTWMTSNLLCLNPFKTEFILIGLRDQLKKSQTIFSHNLDSASTNKFIANSPVRNLDVIFDQNLSVSDHITYLPRSCLMHIRRPNRRIRPLLDFKTASTITTSTCI